MLGRLEPQQEQIIQMMERQVGQMVRLVDDLLEVSRITSGKLELVMDQVDLSAVVQNAVETSRPLVEASQHQLVVAFAQEPLLVEGDPVRLTQVIANLINNAAKYTPDGGQVFVTVMHEGNDAVVRVRDTGLGIPAEVIGEVFELFTQVNRHLKRSQGGIGVGLSLVRRIIEMHGGQVHACSEGEGRGAEFVVRLPLTGNPVKPETVPADHSSEANGTAHRILVVDDNADAADTLSMILRMYGHEIRTTHDGASAVAEAAKFKPEIIFLDLGMPGIDGYETAGKLRELLGEHVMIVALTGWGQQEDRRRTSSAGFNRHLVKPVAPSELLELIASC
jgi:CheY-like chemotaxis protein